MTESRPPAAALLVRAGGVCGLVSTAFPVTTFALTNSVAGLGPAIIAAISRSGPLRGVRVPRIRLAFDIATAVMATASWSRFLVQNYL